ncbi:hypothetical protein PHLGIDRAFT_119307 [Phlebiopsis gigantea 11061_1 CR5-6]|uniref:AAA+ ATPase domain-containing protein n=1 Tax=Phlebiopsis gigantea (strain 11061_1 CR5-6) TaxID=745531 RepID=A0A0C3PJ04_PHLG1|nr:hypothetical protein PHLGIDRAFT_119307 [Phlebiopsis gigantea 11061_1 CR5-6]
MSATTENATLTNGTSDATTNGTVEATKAVQEPQAGNQPEGEVQVKKPEEETPPKPRTRVARYDQFYNPKTWGDELRKTSRVVNKKFSKKKPIILVKRVLNDKGQLDRIDVEMYSESLREILFEINKDVQGIDMTGEVPTVELKLFFHSRFGLREKLAEEEAHETPDEEKIEAIHAALQVIDEDFGRTILDLELMTKQGEITYDMLWALFPPNTYLRAYHHGTEQEMILYARQLSYNSTNEGNYAAIQCDIVSNDGKMFGIAQESIDIFEYKGTRAILDLAAYPLDYHPTKDTLRAHAIQRGKQFAGYTRQFLECSGPAIIERNVLFNDVPVKSSTTTDRVMIDPATFRLFKSNSRLLRNVTRKLDPTTLTDEQLLICTPILLGFNFGSKAWGGFAIDRVKEIVWSDEIFHQLVLGSKHKQLIRGLITQHSAKTSLFDDIVAGKGKGLVGLLCGNPGCGKTLTAEAVAEVTHRPLYIVSAGELGTEPEHLDKKLTEILELAQLWDAVLLLDEADVFMQARSNTDVSRNALVSIFLRQVEYYRGILIFTTNMIESMDQAFESRIHFCIRYPDLDFASRRAIWKMFFSKSMRDEQITDEDLDRLAAHKLNGRQIKNAVSTARSIALQQGAIPSVEHVDTVLEVMSDWQLAKHQQSG